MSDLPRNKFPGLFFLLSLSLMAAFQNKGLAQNDGEDTGFSKKVSFTGQLKNTEDSSITLYFMPFDKYRNYRIELDSAGYFSKEWEIPRPLYLSCFRQKVFVRPGDSIHLEGDMNDIEGTLEFSGDQRRMNNYLKEQARLRDSIRNYKRKLYARSPSDFLEGVDTLLGVYQDLLASQDLPVELRTLEEKRIRWKKAFLRARYKTFHAHYTRKAPDSLDLPEAFYDPLEKIDPNAGSNLSIPSFYRFLTSYTYLLTSEKRRNDSAASEAPFFKIRQKVFENRFNNDTLVTAFLAKNLYDHLQNVGVAQTGPYLERLQESGLYPDLTDSLKARAEEWEPIRKGKEAPGFAYPNVEGDTISLEELEGKLVYIDVWATWCGPCKKEIPHLKELEKAFDEEQVAFVSVSLDRKKVKGRWKRMVENKEIGGHQLFANGEAFDSKIAKDYLINSIPRFILIGPQGKIIDPNAERPSGDAKKELKTLLNE